MIKLMVLNDLHITATPPEGCRPVYLDDIFHMLEEARVCAIDSVVTHSIFTGDLFHRTSLPYRELTRLTRILKAWPGHKLAIAGNHDLDPEGLSGIDKTPLGMLFESGVIEWLRTDKLIQSPHRSCAGYDTLCPGPHVEGTAFGHKEEHPVFLQLSPANWHDGIDDNPANFGLTRKKGVDWAIKIAHGSLMRPGKKYPDGFKLVTYDQVPTEGMDACLFGHIHNDQGVKTVNGCVFAGLGSIGRVARTDYNLRRPRVLLVTLTKDAMKFEKITLTSAVEPELLYYAKSLPGVEIDEPMSRFARDMEKSLALEDVSLDDALSSVTGKGVEKPVVKVVKELLEKSGY